LQYIIAGNEEKEPNENSHWEGGWSGVRTGVTADLSSEIVTGYCCCQYMMIFSQGRLTECVKC